MSNNKVLIDVMVDGRFSCQLRYNKRGFPEMIDGEVVEVHRAEDIEEFVYSKRPSLRGKNIRIETTDQRVYP